MTGKLSKNFHGVGIGPLSNISAVKYFMSQSGKFFFVKCMPAVSSKFSILSRYVVSRYDPNNKEIR